jgi:N-acetylglucosamine-6-sulfatase
MRRMVLPLTSVGFAVMLSLAVALLSGAYTDSVPTADAQTASKPNFVFILTDDMRKDDLKYMPKTRSLLKAKGMSFANAFVTNALCCPSRATIMRGQYPHNTGVWDNVNGTDGGWDGYKVNHGEEENVATRLHDAGYRTGLIGKYFNGYQGTDVPAGWDKWFATYNFNYFDYDVNDNGTKRHFGTATSDYVTDVLRRQTQSFIDTSVTQVKPFFAYVAPSAPHAHATPAPRNLHDYDGLKGPRLPSFNEKDVSDKPPWIRQLPRLTTDQIAEMDNLSENRAESLQAVDDLVEGVVTTLANREVLGNTYIVFTSDNGFFRGEHRIPNRKARPYEEAVRVPLLIRGPSIPGQLVGSTTSQLALNTDYLPTFTDLACSPSLCGPEVTQNWSYVPDGRSLRPVLNGSATTWRTAILLEAHQTGAGDDTPTYASIRGSGGRKYTEYVGGRKELYNLGADPYELTNRYDANAAPTDLASRLQALKACAGASCRSAENGGQ